MSDKKDEERTVDNEWRDAENENQRPADLQGDDNEDRRASDEREKALTEKKGEDNGQDMSADDGETENKPTETDNGPDEGSLTQAGDADNSNGGSASSGAEDEIEKEPVVTDENIDETSEDVPNLPAQTATTGSEHSENSVFAAGQEPDSIPVPEGEPVEDAFEDVAVEDVEADEIWAEVTEEKHQELADETAKTESSEAGQLSSEVDEVSKHDYCEGCEYFSEAPEIRCTHEGTEILEFVDMDHVRVSNCPIVAERKGLEEGDPKGSTAFGEMQRD